jgi:hypothetical protein
MRLRILEATRLAQTRLSVWEELSKFEQEMSD